MHKTHTGLSDAQAEIEYLKVSMPYSSEGKVGKHLAICKKSRIPLLHAGPLSVEIETKRGTLAKEARTLCSLYQLYRLLILLQNIYVKN